MARQPNMGLVRGSSGASASSTKSCGGRGRGILHHIMRLNRRERIALMGTAVWAEAEEARPRAREIGLAPGVFPPGALNAITDVAGVRVGNVTLVEGDNVRTGVTVIVPHDGNVFQDKVSGGVFVGNAFGKLAGSTQVQELGTIETPVVLDRKSTRLNSS